MAFHHTEETKRKLSDLRRGDKNPFYGRKHTDEFKAKQAERTRRMNLDRSGRYLITPCKLKDPGESLWAYVAGLLDGEGSIILANGKRQPSIAIYNTNVPVMEWLLANIGGSRSKHGARNPIAREPCFAWCVYSVADIYFFLKKVRGFLIIKADKADKLLSYLETRYKGRL